MLLIVVMAALIACEEEVVYDIEVRSAAFGHKETIPKKHTCQGEGLSPPLTFSSMPDGTVSVAVIMDDPDRLSGTFTHWLLWGLPSKTTVPEDVALNLPENAVHGMADDGKTEGYLAPCPPAGNPHRYVFKAYALDTKIDLESGATREQLDDKMKNHILGYGELQGVVAPK
jgi:Raf kinase inhibitor-like YbhB/YbcL family protein